MFIDIITVNELLAFSRRDGLMAHKTRGVLAAESNITRSEAPLFCDFVEARYLPFVRQNKQN